MIKYICNRLAQSILVLVGVTLVTFILLNVVPGDPVAVMLNRRADQKTVERVRHELGLDRPLTTQYIEFLTNTAKGDFGVSYFDKKPVSEMLWQGFKTTIRLGSYAFIFATIFGLIIGILSAVYRGKIVDKILMFMSMLGISAPVFWIAVIFQIVFGLYMRILPISGAGTGIHMVLPTITLGLGYAASTARLARTNVLEALSQDYVRTARSKGLNEFVVVMKHILKNAAIPIVTLLGLQIKGILGGSMIVETIFSLPGIGKLAISAIMARDIPVIQATVVYVAVIFVAINLILDLLYGYLDPRVRVSKGA